MPSASIPLTERQARYRSDVTPGISPVGKPEHCYRASPDEVGYRKPIQHITMSLLGHPTEDSLPGLLRFTRRTGIPA